jgi:hypothetical protein
MTRSRWLLLVAVAGLAIFALSFVNAWIVHDRELRGEGYRFVQYYLSAWRGVGMPVLTLAAVGALATAVWAVVLLRGRSLPAWPLVATSAVVVGLVLAAAWPVAQDAHASSVDLSSGPLLPIGLVLAIGMLVGAVAAVRPPRRVMAAVGGVVLVALVVGVGGRWLGLQLAEGTGRHWSEGDYVRAATDGQPEQVLSIGDGTFAVSDRWAGTWEWSGWTIVVDDDPACPESRGAYHAHGVGEDDLRFVKIVDTCQDGARAADLETGVWERRP